MSTTLALPILEELLPGGFRYGSNLLVRFDPRSIWYETSLTIAAHAVKRSIRTEYHIFQHIPNEVREALTRLGLDVGKLEVERALRIIDSYTIQLKIGVPEGTGTGGVDDAVTQSLKVSDYSIAMARKLKEGHAEQEKRGLHIDDNTGIILQYNEERAVIDFWRTRIIPLFRASEDIALHSLLTGVASDAFCRQFESLCDGIVDFKSEDRAGEIVQSVRLSAMRGRPYDSRWRELRLMDNGEVVLGN